jgi:aryl-alcohol dehydrogenase-like predicted oxidoreductase
MNTMKTVFLGRSGLAVSQLALGTQTFGWGCDEATAFALADRYAEAGGNFFDTSSSYNDGKSETILGSWVAARKNRSEVVLATKVFFPTGNKPNDQGLSRAHIFDSVDVSLRRLRTDYIDLYQAHCCDLATPLDETLAAFEDLVRAGKVRYIGVSNFTASQITKSVMIQRMRGWSSLVSLQAEYSLLVRSTEWELLPVCREEGLALLAWSPLAGGWLSGKYRRGEKAPADSRVGRADRWDDQPEQRESDATWRILDVLGRIASRRGTSQSQVALNYLKQQGRDVIPIFGARTMEQLEDNLGSVEWSLDESELKDLEACSRVPLPYPYSFIERYTRRR